MANILQKFSCISLFKPPWSEFVLRFSFDIWLWEYKAEPMYSEFNSKLFLLVPAVVAVCKHVSLALHSWLDSWRIRFRSQTSVSKSSQR